MLSKRLAVLAAASLIATSSAAIAQPAHSLSLSNSPVVQRAATSGHKKSGIAPTILVAVIAIPALAVGSYLIIHNNSNNKPKSP